MSLDWLVVISQLFQEQMIRHNENWTPGSLREWFAVQRVTVDYLPKRTLYSRNHKLCVTIRDDFWQIPLESNPLPHKKHEIAVVQCGEVAVRRGGNAHGCCCIQKQECSGEKSQISYVFQFIFTCCNAEHRSKTCTWKMARFGTWFIFS